ncbi:MAG: phage tail protein, partial [Bacteroidota bacterium]
MATYKTPGVYIEEVSNFPPSVVPVETAIPAFIGYTEKAMKQNGENLHMVPTKIRSLGEFEQWYGAAPPMTANVYLDSDDQVSLVAPVAQFYTFDSLRMFFDNGGGDCYIISIGKYQTAGIIKSPSKQDFLNGLSELEKVDEPTIILFPDASLINKNTPNAIDLYDVQKAALSQCNKLQDRVLVCDLKNDAGGSISELEGKVQEFRDNIGINFLKYG